MSAKKVSLVYDESPVQSDFSRVEKFDELGNSYISYEPFDYPSHQASLGIWNDWSLDSLLKAGINPNFPIHTGFGTRLEGLSVVDEFSSAADKILSDENKDSNS